MAYSPDGARGVSASEDGSLKLWATGSGKLIATLYGHLQPVRAVAFSPDGSRIASVSQDRTLRLWDVVTQEMVLSFRAHQDWPLAVAFSPDGAWLASSGKSIAIWRTMVPGGQGNRE